MLLTFSFLIIGIYAPLVATSADPVLSPNVDTFLMEGGTFTATCDVVLDDPAQSLKFVNKDNVNLKNSTDGTRTFFESRDGNKQLISITWHKLALSDTKDVFELTCQTPGNAGYAYNVRLIPKANLPVITLNPSNVTKERGSESTFKCGVTVEWYARWKELSIEWLINDQEITNKLNKYDIVNQNNAKNNKSSELTVKNMDNQDSGVYTCRANLEYSEGSPTYFPYDKTTNVIVKWTNAGVPKKEEVAIVNEEAAVMVCVIEGLPTPTLEWKKDGNVITGASDARYSFSNSTQQPGDNSKFTISKATYSDRGVYKCVATFGPGSVKTKEFVLRVRDPLGALWPAIGILVEAVLLFFIIAIYSCIKKPKHGSDAVDGREDNGETAPLVKDGPKVSYNTGEDGVRARVTST